MRVFGGGASQKKKSASPTACLKTRSLPGGKPMEKIFLRASLAFLVVFGGAFAASAQTGQTAFGQTTTEAAINDANGSTIYLLTPDRVPMPSNANPRAHAPMFIPIYPTSSPINPATLDCQP